MAEHNSIAIGLASGIGNAVFMLPTIKALKEQGNNIALFVQGDYPMGDLFRRCAYADEVIEPPQSINGHRPICGHWKPKAWERMNIPWARLGFPYAMSETVSNLSLIGISDPPNVSDWCKGLDRTPRWDIGIIPGCKSGAWMRKRYPAMKDIAAFYMAQGKKVAVFGVNDDGIDEIPGEVIKANLASLPDALAGCRVIIGTDSGPTHLASSLGVPVVMVFTATSEVKGRPLGPHRIVANDLHCRPCQTTSRWWACREWKCREIDTQKVTSAAEELL